jgi:hypothetical protein
MDLHDLYSMSLRWHAMGVVVDAAISCGVGDAFALAQWGGYLPLDSLDGDRA